MAWCWQNHSGAPWRGGPPWRPDPPPSPLPAATAATTGGQPACAQHGSKRCYYKSRDSIIHLNILNINDAVTPISSSSLSHKQPPRRSSSACTAFLPPLVSPRYSPRASSSCQWLHTGASVLAAIMPLAAAAGTPMPGAHESPQRSRPGRGVPGPGKLLSAAEMAGPAARKIES